jgi:hypothetical protein
MERSENTKGGEMQTTSEKECRMFAAEFDTPNVRQAIALCEAGTLTWSAVAEIFRASLAKGLAEVA